VRRVDDLCDWLYGLCWRPEGELVSPRCGELTLLKVLKVVLMVIVLVPQYAIFLAIILLLEMTAGILGFIFKDWVRNKCKVINFIPVIFPMLLFLTRAGYFFITK